MGLTLTPHEKIMYREIISSSTKRKGTEVGEYHDRSQTDRQMTPDVLQKKRKEEELYKQRQQREQLEQQRKAQQIQQNMEHQKKDQQRKDDQKRKKEMDRRASFRQQEQGMTTPPPQQKNQNETAFDLFNSPMTSQGTNLSQFNDQQRQKMKELYKDYLPESNQQSSTTTTTTQGQHADTDKNVIDDDDDYSDFRKEMVVACSRNMSKYAGVEIQSQGNRKDLSLGAAFDMMHDAVLLCGGRKRWTQFNGTDAIYSGNEQRDSYFDVRRNKNGREESHWTPQFGRELTFDRKDINWNGRLLKNGHGRRYGFN